MYNGMYKCARAERADQLAAQVTRERDWVPHGPPRYRDGTYYQMQVRAGNHALLAQALRDMASNCPTASTKAEKLMASAALPILAVLNAK